MSNPTATTPAEVLPAGFARHTADVNGTRLSYLMGGRGVPVLLLHGWPQTSQACLRVLEPLASRGYTLIAPGLRGLGRSQRATTGYGKRTRRKTCAVCSPVSGSAQKSASSGTTSWDGGVLVPEEEPEALLEQLTAFRA